MDTPERLAQARKLAELATRISEPGDRLVVCGDFNVEPDSETFRVLREIGLTDLVTSRGFAGTRNSHYTKPGRFADYMLVNDAVDGGSASMSCRIPKFRIIVRCCWKSKLSRDGPTNKNGGEPAASEKTVICQKSANPAALRRRLVGELLVVGRNRAYYQASHCRRSRNRP